MKLEFWPCLHSNCIEYRIKTSVKYTWTVHNRKGTSFQGAQGYFTK